MTKKIDQMAVRFRSLADGDGIAFKWESSLDKILTAGNYAVEIEHYGADVGLPIKGCGTEHSIVGTLVVTDSGALGNKQGDRVIGQVLTFTLRESKETSIYTRTYAGGEWSEWCSLARTGMYDEITNADALYSTVTSLASATKELEENLVYGIKQVVDADKVQISTTNGDGCVKDTLEIPAVTTKKAGVMTAADKAKLNNDVPYPQETGTMVTSADKKYIYRGSGDTDVVAGLYWQAWPKTVDLRVKKWGMSTNDEVSVLSMPAATTESAGVMSAEDKNNLDIIAFRDIYKASHIDETLAKAGILLSDGTIDTISPSVPNWRTFDKVKFESGLYINPSVGIGEGYCNYVTFDGNYNVIRFGKSVSEMVLHKETTEEYVSVCVYKLDECYIGGNCSEKVNVLSENVDSLQTLVIERLEFPFQGYIDKNGEFVSHILHQTTDFISCTSLEVSLHWKISVLNSSFINFYDVDKNWIGILSNAFIEDGTFTNRIIKVPKEAYYVRVSANNEESYSGRFVPKFVPDRKKATVERNVNFVGQSIWWYDGKQLATGIGGGVIANGYQALLKEKFSFLSDTGTAYCYSGFSLGALTDNDTSSICNKMDTWAESINALWTLDTITNDFKRNIPIGNISDYNNSTGKTTYYGALRLFSDKIQELSGDDKIVIVSNALRRNSGGYTSVSENTVGHTLVDYEKALLEVAVLNGWWFVDQFRLSGIADETINLTTIDGLHLNNLGYKLAVLPWVNTINILAR